MNYDIRFGLVGAVTQAVGILYSEIANRLSSPEYPDEILSNMKTLPTEVIDKSIIGTILIDASEDSAPMALAFEFGSGIWATIGTKGYIHIQPKESGKMLSFLWPDAASIAQREGIDKVTFGEDGKVFLPDVWHPGIQPRPYIQPSIIAKADEITEIIGDEWLVSLSEFLGDEEEVLYQRYT